MVQDEEQIIRSLFYYEDGNIIGKDSPHRRKASNSRVKGRKLGCVNHSGHLVMNFTVNGVKFKKLVHHVVWYLHHGEWPAMIDHIDRNPSNNKIENLRLADKSLNSQNRGAQSNTKHGMRGIYKDKLGGYCVYIGINNKRLILGRTNCIGQAWKMRKDAEAKYWPNV